MFTLTFLIIQVMHLYLRASGMHTKTILAQGLYSIQRTCDEHRTLEYYKRRCMGKKDKAISYRTCDSVSVLYNVEQAKSYWHKVMETKSFCCHWQWCCETCVQMITQLENIGNEDRKAMESRSRIGSMLDSILSPQRGGGQVPVVSGSDVASTGHGTKDIMVT